MVLSLRRNFLLGGRLTCCLEPGCDKLSHLREVHAMQVFLPFSKVETQSDGSIRIHGVASSETRDSDGEVINASAIRDAIPDFVRFGGVGSLREMHNAQIAAGIVDAISVDDDDMTRVSALVVDEGSRKKILAGVLRGFSLGGRVTKRDPQDQRTITAVDLVECSIVDRPSNPDCVLSLAKVDRAKSAFFSAFHDELRKASSMKSDNLSPFTKAVLDEFRKMMAADDGAEDNHDMNAANPNPVVAPDEPEGSSMLHNALQGLHSANPPPSRSPLLESFGLGISGANFYDLTDRATRPSARPARDHFIERLLAGGGAELPSPPPPRRDITTPEGYAMLRPNGGEAGDSGRLNKAQNRLAPEYRGNLIYAMLLPNGPSAPSALRKAASPAPAYAGETAALLRSNSAA